MENYDVKSSEMAEKEFNLLLHLSLKLFGILVAILQNLMNFDEFKLTWINCDTLHICCHVNGAIVRWNDVEHSVSVYLTNV